MKLKEGWVTEKVNESVISIGTPFVRPDGDHITFYMTDTWLTDERDFWFEVQSRFENEIDIMPKIWEVLAKYDSIYIEMDSKKICGRRIYKTHEEIYNFGEALNELYQIKFEGEDGKRKTKR